MLVPFASIGVQANMAVLQNWPVAQSASTRQPPVGMHWLEVEHEPPRHVVAAFSDVQGPWPLARPHLPSPSHTPPLHKVVALFASHMPAPFG
jgi:hypothetical protein